MGRALLACLLACLLSSGHAHDSPHVVLVPQGAGAMTAARVLTLCALKGMLINTSSVHTPIWWLVFKTFEWSHSGVRNPKRRCRWTNDDRECATFNAVRVSAGGSPGSCGTHRDGTAIACGRCVSGYQDALAPGNPQIPSTCKPATNQQLFGHYLS
eukprot:6036554-Amphidinium_carterae.1